MTEAQLITNILAGNSNDFAPLVERYLPMVRGLCRSHVYDPAAEEDLVQDSLLEGFRKLSTLRNRERFGPWLAAITRNKCKNWLRGQSRRAKAYRAVAEEEPSATEPMGMIARKELYAWVREQIAGLPDKTREAMLLHYVEGASIAEASEFLGISVTAVKQRLFYGRQRIGDHLWNQFGEKTELARDTDALRRRVLAAVPDALPVSGPAPFPLPVALSLGTLVAAALFAIGVFAFAPAPSEVAEADASMTFPSVHFVAQAVVDGQPGAAPLPGLPVRIAPQEFNRDALETLLRENGIDETLWDPIAEQFINTPGWDDFMNDETMPQAQRERAFTALESLAAMVAVIPMDMAMEAYESILPPPPDDAWRELETDGDGRLNVSAFAPGIYVLRAGDDPPADIAPWLDLNRHRIRIPGDEAMDVTITLPPR